MAGRAKGDRELPIDPGALDDLLPLAMQIVAQMGDAGEQELSATLTRSLRDPTFEGRLRQLPLDEGVSPKHQKEYLRMFSEWRRASESAASAIDGPRESPKPGS